VTPDSSNDETGGRATQDRSLLPIGLLQAVASMNEGLWFARSADFLQQPLIETLRWMRMVGDVVFLLGVASLARFVIGLRTGWSFQKGTLPAPSPARPGRKARGRKEALVTP
jgi:hypothetical protein